MSVVETGTGIARLEAAFARAKAEGRGALIPYLCAGDPDRETSAAMLAMLARARIFARCVGRTRGATEANP